MIKIILFFSILTLLSVVNAFSQKISGKILDKESGQALIGASVVIKGTTIGTTVDFDGNFELNVNQKFPVTLVISFIGYTTTEQIVNTPADKIRVKLGTDQILLNAVEVTDTRISEKQKQAALTVEQMDVIAIKEAPSGNFYEGLGNLKGVDITSASLGFKVINTRGFNSTSPVRSLQLIDGVDNQSPGLNFSLGNFLGAPDLDVMKVDIVAGASSAFFGPNAFNGVVSMTTKSPFLFKGVSASVKVGERNLTEYAVRWAEVIKDKNGKDRWGFKINAFYFKALDWFAENYNPVQDSKVGKDNPGGFDAVNIYGDEALEGGNDFSQTARYKNNLGLGIFHRTGFRERDLVDYNTRNLKTNASVHYKLTDKIEMIAAGNYSTGTTVYQGDNRYSLKDIQFYQTRFEIKQEDKFFLRAYMTGEDAGNSYDAVLTGFLINKASVEDRTWYNRYKTHFNTRYSGVLNQILRDNGINLANIGLLTEADRARIDAIFANNQDKLTEYHNATRDYVNAQSGAGISPAFQPGTASFDSVFNDITGRKFTENGSRFFDRSKLYHIQGEYKFTPTYFDWVLGGNMRWYRPDSRGTIFSDTLVNRADTTALGYDIDGAPRVRITNYEFGLYTGIEKKFFEDKLKTTFTMRLDKNVNFNMVISPAISAVYSPNQNHTYRVSFSSALRNPTLADQYLYYNVGRAILLGNLNGIDNLVTVASFRNYLALPTPSDTALRFFSVRAIRPEQVRTFEVGYRATFWDKVYVDIGYYYSFYTDFIGYKIGVDLKRNQFAPVAPGTQAYRVAANAEGLITTQGLSVGTNYYFAKKFALNGNYSWNKLNNLGNDDQIIPAFNTPEHKFNIGIGGREFSIGNVNNLGFSANYKWVSEFVFEGSPQFTGIVPQYDLVDAQVNWKWVKYNTTFRLGASNLLNKQVFQVYGGPVIGRLAYFSILFEWDKK